MLIDITIKNFRSIKDEVTLSLETGARLTKFKQTNTFPKVGTKIPSLVKSAFIFGPNANGKTNVLHAFDFLASLLKTPTDDIDDVLFSDTFGGNDAATSFLVNFTKDNQLFRYYFEYTENEVVSEYLDVAGKRVLHRERQNFEVIPKTLVPFVASFRKNQALLYLAQSYNYDMAQLAFTWLTQDVVFVRNGSNELDVTTLRRVKDSPSLKERLLNFMQAADFGISDFEIVKSEHPKQLEIYFRHQTVEGDILLPFRSESEGTKVFVSLALQLLANRGTGKLLLIDEFERSLHAELAQSLLKIFNHEQQHNQFIVTTHSLDLMDEDLRVDQIWFVEKNEFGESELYNLFDFDMPSTTRGDYSYKKRYIAGLFGATQIVNQNRLLQNVFEK